MPVAVLLSAALTAGVCMAEPDIQASNTLRLEHYSVSGDASASPYPVTGFQAFDQLDLNFRQRNAPYNQLSGQASVLINASDYRSNERGGALERFHLAWENGEAGLPFRLEGGDLYGFFSPATLQRGIKGLSLDLQPRRSDPATRDSLALISGVSAASWSDVDEDSDITHGVSYVRQQAAGALALNLVNNQRAAGQDQWVASVAGERSWVAAGHKLGLEGEFGRFRGDHDTGQDRMDAGAYLQVAGQALARPLNYRLRLERFGADYRPAGAATTADRRGREAHAGWTFASGLNLRGRWLAYRDGWEGPDPLTTRTLGFSLGGPFWSAQQLSGFVDAFAQTRKNASLSQERRLLATRADFSRPFAGGISGRMVLVWQEDEDEAIPANSATTRQLDLGAILPLAIAGAPARVIPGAYVRSIQGGAGASQDQGLTLGLGLERGRHGLDLNLALREQDPEAGAAVRQLGFGGAYRYQHGRHGLGLELDIHNRSPSPGAATDAVRVAFYWTARLERAAAPRRVTGDPLAAAPGMSIAGLVPGLALDRLAAALDAAGLTGGAEQGALTVFEYPVLTEIQERQRLALVKEAGEVKRVVLAIYPDDPGEPLLLRRSFDRILERLARRYGAPSATLDEGDWDSARWAEDLAAGRFIRVREWHTADGVLRFGLPRRLDGQVRMELTHARDLPPIQQTLWGLEALP